MTIEEEEEEEYEKCDFLKCYLKKENIQKFIHASMVAPRIE